MKTIFIHIGIPKTGTTSIQHSLFLNRELLYKNGYLYPGSLPENHSLPLVYLFQNLKELQKNNYHLKRKDISNAHYESIIKLFIKELHENRDISNVVISGEAILTLKKKDLYRMQLFFKEIFPFHQIKIVCFVRNPVHFMQSLMQQRVRVGKSKIPVRKNLLKRYIKPFIGVFGHENISLHKFEDGVDYEGGIIVYFLSLIAWPENLIQNVKLSSQNVSISSQSYEIINFILELSGYLKNGKDLVKNFGGNFPFIHIQGDRFRLTNEEQICVSKIFIKDVEWFQRTFNVIYNLNNKLEIKLNSKLEYDENYETEFIEAFNKSPEIIQYLSYLFVVYKKEQTLNNRYYIVFNNIYEYILKQNPELISNKKYKIKNVQKIFEKYHKKMNSNYPNLVFRIPNAFLC